MKDQDFKDLFVRAFGLPGEDFPSLRQRNCPDLAAFQLNHGLWPANVQRHLDSGCRYCQLMARFVEPSSQSDTRSLWGCPLL